MTDRRWPTAEQFDAASAAGADRARAQIAVGATRPEETPLSGEWADSPSPRSVALAVGYREHVEAAPTWERGVEELAAAWERGYYDVWDHAIQAAHTPQEG